MTVIQNRPLPAHVHVPMIDPLVYLESPPLTVAENIALDRLLMQAVGDDTMPEHLRLYSYTDEAVVLGISQQPDQYVTTALCREDGIAVLKRFSGGGTVCIDAGCVVYSVIVKTGRRVKAFNVRDAYRYVFSPIIEQFAHHGTTVSFFPPCDLAVQLRKIAGNAQAQKHGAILVHGSFLVHADIERIERYLKHPAEEPEYRSGRSHNMFLANLSEFGYSCDSVADLLKHAWTEQDGNCTVKPELVEKAIAEAGKLQVSG